MNATKSDLVKAVMAAGIANPIEAEKAVQATLDAIAQSLANGVRVEIRDFGVFDIRETRERMSNLKPGVIIPSGNKVTFKMGKKLGEMVAPIA